MKQPLKVIYFAINYRPTRDSISPCKRCNIAGLISNVFEAVATQITKNCRGRQPHCHLMPRIGEPPRISAYALYFRKLELLGYIFVADSMGLSSFI